MYFQTHIVLINRKDGKEWKRFRTQTLFFLHIINCFEKDNQLTVDICTYKDPKALDAMYVKAIEVRIMKKFHDDKMNQNSVDHLLLLNGVSVYLRSTSISK